MMAQFAVARRGRQWLHRAWQGQRYGARTIILAYHRVASVDRDPLSLCVQPDHFADHLAVLRSYRVVPLCSIPAILGEGGTPKETVSITMDDGYADNLYAAKPLLEAHDVPATVFVTSGQTGSGREFWWDELDRLVHEQDRLPEAPLPSELLGELAPRFPDRRARYEALHARLYSATTQEKASLLDAIRCWSNSTVAMRPSHAVLTRDELTKLADGGLIEIGGHSVSHPRLDTLSEAEQRTEIVDDRHRLEAFVGRKVRSFAYPHGRYSARTAALVAEAGYERACTVEAVPSDENTDPFTLPRVLVRDMDGEQFARKLHEWFTRSPARGA